MKRGGCCPKCGGRELALVEGKVYNSFSVGLTNIRLERWICCTCGYSEEWVPAEKLDKVKEYGAESSSAKG